VSLLRIGRAPSIALGSIASLLISFAVHADEIESPERILSADEFAMSSQFGEETSDVPAPSFGIRRGRGFQLERKVEINDQKYEFNLSGPIIKSGQKRKNFGLNFEVRF